MAAGALCYNRHMLRKSAMAPHLIVAAMMTGIVAVSAGCGAAPSHSAAGRAGGLSTRSIVPRMAAGAGIRDVGLIVEPDDGTGVLTRAIRNANTSIWLTMYLLTNHTIIHDLEYAHAYGVDVRVILEPHPYGSIDNINLSAYNNLLAADIPTHWSSARFRLTHEKSMLIDGVTAYIMTTNFTRAAFRSNREFDIIDHNPADVAAVRTLFAADWRNQPYVAHDPNLPISPNDARPLLSDLVGAAHHTLDVYAEELQDSGMEQALVDAARRHVHVRLMLPAPSGRDTSAADVAMLASAGVAVRRMPRSYLYFHAKAIVVDGHRAFVGSQNLSSASLDGNRELGVIVADQQAINTIEQTFETDWRQGSA